MEKYCDQISPIEHEIETKSIRTKRETKKMMSLIKQANHMKKLDDHIDKTPATVTKFKSNGGQSYMVNLNKDKSNFKK